jgi:hypothetical protein
MALLGNGGILELSREWPEPMALASTAIIHSTTPARINLGNTDYWTGDRIVLNFPDGSPFAGGNPPGSGVYFGGVYVLSQARLHVTGPNANYYQADDSVAFYDSNPITPFTYGYINIDPLGRIRLFSTELAAYNLDTSAEIPINPFSTINFVVARYSSDSAYLAAISSVAESIKNVVLPSDNQLLEDVTAVPAAITAISEDPDGRGWLIQCELTEWALDIDAANLDMTAIGETFGENSKALVRGAGSLQFLAENKLQAGEQTSSTLLRLVLLTERNTKASAKFYLYKNRTPVSPQIGSTAYYGCDLLLTNSRINVRAGELIAGSTDFVVSGEIALRFT